MAEEDWKNEIKLEYNKSKITELDVMAQYFAHSKTACFAQLDKIKPLGISISFTQVDRNSNGLVLSEVEVAFNKKCDDKDSVIRQLTTLEKEAMASKRLDKMIDKGYVPPGRQDPDKIEFFMPSVAQLSVVTLYWAVVYQAVFGAGPQWLVSIRESFGIIWRIIFLTFVVINFGFGIAVLGFVRFQY